MRFTSLLLVALAAESSLASSWFGKAVYNKWHETELERWLSDHNVPYPTPADRKDLENLVKNNWQSKVVSPYNDWEAPQINAYLKGKGVEVQKSAASNKNALSKQLQASWTETADAATESYSSVKGWIFNSWSDSQLKAFADKNGIPVPQPRKRDTLLATVRDNYDSAAKKLKEYSAYPGNWIYESWSESDLKLYLDERGIPAPQPSTRDKLIASVRRNSRLAALSIQETAASASSSAAAAQQSLTDLVFDSWSDSKLKEWADENGIKVPQGTKRNELIAIARKHRASLLKGNTASSVSSGFHAATTKAGNEYAKATDNAQLKAESAFNSAVDTWSDSRLKAYLDSRGVPVPQAGKRDELLAAVRLNRHKAATGWSAWTYDTWTAENLKKWLNQNNAKAAKKAGNNRDALLKVAQDNYASASKAGGANYASVTSYLAQSTDSAKQSTFDTWSESDLKSYLDSYGVTTYQGSTVNELRALARRNANYFRYGTTTPQGTLYAKFQNGVQWVFDQLKFGAASGRKEAGYQAEKAADAVKEGATAAKDRTYEAGQKAQDKIKEEL